MLCFPGANLPRYINRGQVDLIGFLGVCRYLRSKSLIVYRFQELAGLIKNFIFKQVNKKETLYCDGTIPWLPPTYICTYFTPKAKICYYPLICQLEPIVHGAIATCGIKCVACPSYSYGQKSREDDKEALQPQLTYIYIYARKLYEEIVLCTVPQNMNY